MPLKAPTPRDNTAFFLPGGTMGEMIRSMDWSITPLGPMEHWPQSLFSNLALILESPFPMQICWGRELTILYNDPFIPILGSKHPALGKRLLEVWHETRASIEPLTEKAFAGEAVHVQGGQFDILRHEYPETTWFDYSFSPLRDASGHVVGLLNTTVETTSREKSLRESENRLLTIFEGVNDGIYVRNVKGRLLDVNRIGYERLGFTKEELLGTVPTAIEAPEDTVLFHERIQRIVDDGRLSFETVHMHKDGHRIPVEINSRLIVFQGQAAILSVVRDISERKRTDQALQESRERFSKAFHSNPAAMAISDIESGRLIDINAKWQQILGYTREESIGRTTAELGIWADPDQRPRLIRKLLAEGSFQEAPSEFITKTGEIRHSLWSAELIEYGGKVAVLSLVYDITDRKRAEEARETLTRQLEASLEARRESEEKYQQLVQESPISIMSFDAEGTVTFVNEWHLSTFARHKYDADFFVGKKVTELPGIVLAGVAKELGKVLQGERVALEDVYFPIFTGEHDGYQNIRAVPIYRGGKLAGGILIREDVTERKRAEEKLRHFANELEARVRKRTHQLEQANRAKDEFLANMSHEIRTPLAGVLGLTEILLHQDLPANVSDDLELVRSSANSVLTLINDLFDLSRISQGKFEFHPRVVAFRSMVDEALGPFWYQAMAKELDFTIAIDESIPRQIICDQDRLGQVMKNLVSNAIKFTHHGFVKVEAKAESSNAETVRLFVTVSDSGIGIPTSKQKDVFDAFTQLDPSYSKQFAGMGLGLAISRSLVEGMGGEITVDSTEGKGATFSFFVNCAWASQDRIAPVEGPSLSDIPPMAILLVEDNAVNRLFLRRALVTAGHKVGEAENGNHALAKLGEVEFDLVLMDIQMPEMDGVEATRRIRSGKHGRADIPIIALTAYAMKGDREKFLENGMDGYVTKPVDFGELARVIAEVCDIRDGERSRQ
jgi:PAS domain S-box-containing protein